MSRMNVPNLGGTLILVLVLVALLPVYNSAFNLASGELGGFAVLLARLVVPMILLAIIANLWAGNEEVIE